MRTWSATFLASFVMGLFAYVTFIKENPVSGWWWTLAVFFLIQIILHDAVEDYNTEGNESDMDQDSKDDE
jgi:hypothetical protein